MYNQPSGFPRRTKHVLYAGGATGVSMLKEANVKKSRGAAQKNILFNAVVSVSASRKKCKVMDLSTWLFPTIHVLVWVAVILFDALAGFGTDGANPGFLTRNIYESGVNFGEWGMMHHVLYRWYYFSTLLAFLAVLITLVLHWITKCVNGCGEEGSFFRQGEQWTVLVAILQGSLYVGVLTQLAGLVQLPALTSHAALSYDMYMTSFALRVLLATYASHNTETPAPAQTEAEAEEEAEAAENV